MAQPPEKSQFETNRRYGKSVDPSQTSANRVNDFWSIGRHAIPGMTIDTQTASSMLDNMVEGAVSSLAKINTSQMRGKFEQAFSKVMATMFNDIQTAVIANLQGAGAPSLSGQQLASFFNQRATYQNAGQAPAPAYGSYTAAPAVTGAQLNNYLGTNQGPAAQASSFPGLPSYAGPNIPLRATPNISGNFTVPPINPYFTGQAAFANAPTNQPGVIMPPSGNARYPAAPINGQTPPPIPGSGGGGLNWGRVGIAAGVMGAGSYYRAVSGEMDQERENMIAASRLQTLSHGDQGFEPFFNRLASRGGSQAESTYGYLAQDTIKAAGAYLPYTRGAPANVADIFAGFGETSGTGMQGAASFYGQLAQMGGVGGAQGSETLKQIMPAISVAFGMSTQANAGAMQDGMAGLAQQVQGQNVTFQRGQLNQLIGYYGAAASTGMAASQINQTLGAYNQGVTGLTGQDSATQMMAYQALGGRSGISPAEIMEATQRGGLFAGRLASGRHVNNLQSFYGYIKSTFAGTGLENQAYQFAKLTGTSMPEALSMMKLAPTLLSGNADKNVSEFGRLTNKFGVDMGTATGAAQANLIGEAVAGETNRGQMRTAVADMKSAGISGVGDIVDSSGRFKSGKTIDDLVGRIAGTSTVKTKAADVQLNMNSIQQALDDGAHAVEGFDGAVRTATAHIIDTINNTPGGAGIAYGGGFVANTGMNLAQSLLGQGAGSFLANLLTKGGGRGLGNVASKVLSRGGGSAVGTAVKAGATALGAADVAAVAVPAAVTVGSLAAAGAAVKWGINPLEIGAQMNSVPGLRDFLNSSAKGSWRISESGWFGAGDPILTDGHNEIPLATINAIHHDSGHWHTVINGQDKILGFDPAPARPPTSPGGRKTGAQAQAAAAAAARSGSGSAGRTGHAAGSTNAGNNNTAVDIGNLTIVLDLKDMQLSINGGHVKYKNVHGQQHQLKIRAGATVS